MIKRKFCIMLLLSLLIMPLIGLAAGDVECGSDPYKVSGVVETVYSSADGKVFVFFEDNDVCYEFNDTCITHLKSLESSEENNKQITVYYDSVNNVKEIIVVHTKSINLHLDFFVGLIIGVVVGVVIIIFFY